MLIPVRSDLSQVPVRPFRFLSLFSAPIHFAQFRCPSFRSRFASVRPVSRTGRQVENIFTSRASSAVLTQDLLDIQRLEQELGMEVEAVDDNIFHWKVGCFFKTSVLRTDPIAHLQFMY